MPIGDPEDVDPQATRIIELRLAGASIRAIAAKERVTEGRVRAVLEKAYKGRKMATEEMVAMELDRLDRISVGLWPQVVAGDPASVQAYLKLMERRAKLGGLDDFERRSLEIKERRLALDEAQALVVVQAVTRAIARAGLSESDAASLRGVVAEEFRALEAADTPPS
jgi:hypothetical protein